MHYQTGEFHAERVLKSEGLDRLPICPFDLAARHGISVQAKATTEPGVTGFLIRVGNQFGICHASHIENNGFIRFTVAHELGHYFLPGHASALLGEGDGIHVSRSFVTSGNQQEEEADGFAAALLMPRSLFVAAMRDLEPGFGAIESLAESCKTSITATAIRYARFADDPVAVLVSSGDTIDYCFMSESLTNCDGLRWIRKGTTLPARCKTRDFNKTRSNITLSKKDGGWTSLDDWFDGAPQIELKEDVIGLGGYGKSLTVLFTEEEILDADSGDDD